MLTVCTLVLLHNTQPVLPSSPCSMLPPSLLGVDCYLPSCLGGTALPRPLPLS
jgi:hypothetical protein